MANVVNPETESITLNTTLEIPTLDPATELEQPLYESTSNPEAEAIVEATPLDADALTEPVVEAAEERLSAAPEVVAEPEAELPPPAAATPPIEIEDEAEPVPAIAAEAPAQAPALIPAPAPEAHAVPEPGEDFSAALAAFEREQAAEAAAVEVYGDKIVSGKVQKQTDKYLVVDVGL